MTTDSNPHLVSVVNCAKVRMRHDMVALRKSLSESTDTVFADGRVLGFAIVFFEKEGDYRVAYDMDKLGVLPIDIPDMVRARLQREIMDG